MASTWTILRTYTKSSSTLRSIVGSQRFVLIPLETNCPDASHKRTFSTNEPELKSDTLQLPALSKNALHNLLGDTFTPGQALRVLQQKGSGGSQISKADFTALCQSVRPGKMRDSRVVYNALGDLSRCWNFELQDTQLASLTVDVLMRGFLPVLNDDDSQQQYAAINRVKAATYAAQAFTDRRTGLYYATDTATMNRVLGTLLEGLEGLTESSLPEEKAEAEADATAKHARLKLREPAKQAALYLINPPLETLRRRIKRRCRYVLRRVFGNQSVPRDTITLPSRRPHLELPTPDVLERVVRETFYTLLLRMSNPEEKMKKKMRRRYLKTLVTNDGPTPETVRQVLAICALVGNTNSSATEMRTMVGLWTKKQLEVKDERLLDDEGDQYGEIWKMVEEMEADQALDADDEDSDEVNEDIVNEDVGADEQGSEPAMQKENNNIEEEQGDDNKKD